MRNYKISLVEIQKKTTDGEPPLVCDNLLTKLLFPKL